MSATTSPSAGRPGRARIVWRLTVPFSPCAAALDSARFVARALVLGRMPGSDAWEIADNELSRRHAAFTLTDDGRLTFRDVASRNGVFLDGARVTANVDHTLDAGQVLRVGATVIVVERVDVEALEVLRAPPKSDYLVGQSTAWLAAVARAQLVARAPLPVLLLGETGAGKELIAAEVHRASKRIGPFVAVNCAALPDHLVESELFGHERGAFTGADRRTDGLFASADRGTLFLDEIGEMPLLLQAKLLRVLATGEVRGVGATSVRRYDVRVVAATNVDVEAAAVDGSFRGDLYARLAGAVVALPPLRERRDDVLRLARVFVTRVTPARAGTSVAEMFSADAAEALVLARWQFNVRELEQRVTLVAALAPPGPITLQQLPMTVRATVESRRGPTQPLSLDDIAMLEIQADRVPTADQLRRVVARHRGNIAQVAAFFGKDRRQIYRWAERLAVELREESDEG